MKNQFFLSSSYIYFQEDELRKGELEADKDKMMREYRAQLDAERATKLALGRNHSGSKSNHKKGRLRNRELFFFFFSGTLSAHFLIVRDFCAEKRDKDLKKRSSKKRKVCSTFNSRFILLTVDG